MHHIAMFCIPNHKLKGKQHGKKTQKEAEKQTQGKRQEEEEDDEENKYHGIPEIPNHYLEEIKRK